jgi:hypothetical protein
MPQPLSDEVVEDGRISHEGSAGNTGMGRPTSEMLAAAAQRLTARRSIVSALMGDPPPGWSALDRRGT